MAWWPAGRNCKRRERSDALAPLRRAHLRARAAEVRHHVASQYLGRPFGHGVVHGAVRAGLPLNPGVPRTSVFLGAIIAVSPPAAAGRIAKAIVQAEIPDHPSLGREPRLVSL